MDFLGVYREFDRVLGVLIDAFPDVDLLLFSMHGMQGNRSDLPTMLFLPELLYRDAFQKVAFTPNPEWNTGRDGVPVLDEAADWSREIIARLDFGKRTKHGFAARVNNLPFMPAQHYQPYWSQMEAFAMPSFYDGRIRINLKGRETAGTCQRCGLWSLCESADAAA